MEQRRMVRGSYQWSLTAELFSQAVLLLNNQCRPKRIGFTILQSDRACGDETYEGRDWRSGFAGDR
jgi:hypothetical protein